MEKYLCYLCGKKRSYFVLRIGHIDRRYIKGGLTISFTGRGKVLFFRIGHIREVVIESGKTSMLSMGKKWEIFWMPHRSH